MEIFLWEKDLKSAQHPAKTGGCSDHLWLTLARACENTIPQEAITIYQARISPIVDQTKNHAYDTAAHYLKIDKKLMKQLGQRKELETYMHQLRTTYKAKRNFVKKIHAI